MGYHVRGAFAYCLVSGLWSYLLLTLPCSSRAQVNILPSSEVTLYIADPAVVKVR